MTAISEGAQSALRRLNGGLVVSCQARGDNPLHGPVFMAASALAAIQGGAAGIRADGEADIAAIRAALGPAVPIMGIFKVKQADGSVFITPSAESARKVITAGAELVALDGTRRARPGGESLADVVAAIHAAGGAAMADIDTLESAQYAVSCGVDAIGTTREQARRALDIGAAFVVVGTAITNPQAITARFVAALRNESR